MVTGSDGYPLPISPYFLASFPISRSLVTLAIMLAAETTGNRASAWCSDTISQGSARMALYGLGIPERVAHRMHRHTQVSGASAAITCAWARATMAFIVISRRVLSISSAGRMTMAVLHRFFIKGKSRSRSAGVSSLESFTPRSARISAERSLHSCYYHRPQHRAFPGFVNPADHVT